MPPYHIPYHALQVLGYKQYLANSTKLVRFLEREEAHLALLPGDLSYADGVSTRLLIIFADSR